jgi:broad specificity phosphatase PhoE
MDDIMQLDKQGVNIMGMPNLLMLVRHGESEANIIQAADDHGTIDQYDPAIVKAIRERPDWEQRLSLHGVQQARVAGEWERANGYKLSEFDAVYCSFYIRARETAYNLDHGFEQLRPHSTIHEQDWGEYGELTPDEQERLFPRTYRLHQQSPMTARFDGGESPLDTMLRQRDFRDTLYRKWSGKRVAAIMHGGTIVATEAMIERWLPEDYARTREERLRKIRNLTHVFYSRENPEDPQDIRDHPNWLRVVYPDDIEASPFGGKWVELPDRRFLGSSALHSSIEAIPRLFKEV